SVQASLAGSVAASAREAGAALQPVLESTLAAIADHARFTRDSVTSAVQQHLDGSGESLRAASAEVTTRWNQALDAQREAGAALLQDLRNGQQQLAETMAAQAGALVERIGARLEEAGAGLAAGWEQALVQQRESSRQASEDQRQVLATAAESIGRQSDALLEALEQSQARLQASLESQEEQRLARWSATLEANSARLRQDWEQAGSDAVARQQAVCDTLASTAAQISEHTQAQARATIAEISQLAHTA